MRSTLNGNTAETGAAGLHNAATATVTASTISGNTLSEPHGQGAGIANWGTMVVGYSTVTEQNAAPETGGGILNGAGMLQLRGSVVVGNSSSLGQDCSNEAGATLQDLGANVLARGTGCPQNNPADRYLDHGRVSRRRPRAARGQWRGDTDPRARAGEPRNRRRLAKPSALSHRDGSARPPRASRTATATPSSAATAGRSSSRPSCRPLRG